MERDLEQKLLFERTVGVENAPSMEETILAIQVEPESRPSHEQHFRCQDCETIFSLPESSFLAAPLKTHCRHCDKPMSIELIASQNGADFVELSGCQVATRVDDLLALEQFGSLSESTVAADSTKSVPIAFIDNLLSSWQVRSADGRVLTFSYFSELRKAIEKKQVGKEDKVILSDGREFRLGEYPGTADLFGNFVIRSQAKNYISGSHPYTPKRKSKFLKRFLHTLALVGIAAAVAGGAFFGPTLYHSFQLAQGDRALRKLLFGHVPSASVDPFKVVTQISIQLQDGAISDLPTLRPSLLSVVASRPSDPESIAILSEVLTEIGIATGGDSDIHAGGDTARLAVLMAPGSVDARRALARHLWRSGEVQKAIDLLSTESDRDFQDSASAILLSRIFESRNDLAQANGVVSRALEQSPNNLSVLNRFVMLLEKQGKFTEAAAYVRRMDRIVGGAGSQFDRLVELYTKAGDMDALETLYREAIRAGQETEKYQYLLIRVLLSQKRLEAATTEAEKYLAGNPLAPHAAEVQELYKTEIAPTKQEKIVHRSSALSRSSRRR